MTNPRYVAGALDLGALKQEAEEKAEGVPAFFPVTQANLESDVLRRSLQVPVIVVVGSAQVEGNADMKKDFAELADAGALSFIVGYVDADATPEIAQALGVRGLPTVLAVAAGQPVTSFEGVQPRAALEQWIGQIVQAVGPQLQGLPAGTVQAGAPAEEEPTPAEDPRLAQATAALNAGDFAAATAVYDEIIAENPPNIAEIRQARGTVELIQRLDPANRTTDAVAEAEADPASVDKQLDAADAEIVAGIPEHAFQRLIETMTAQAGEEKTRVKNRLLELFALFDNADPRVREARTKLASALY